MRAVRLHAPGLGGLGLDEVEAPQPGLGEALVEVHAAAITRDELDWPLDRLPAIPSYELSGIVAGVATDVESPTVGEPVYALTPFDRDGAAAEFAVVPASVLAPKPSTLDHVASAAIPLAALTAWQGLFDHGRLEVGQRVLILGAAGGVGHFGTQLARRRGAHVIGTASPSSLEAVREFGAHEAIERPDSVAPVDLIFDTVGGELLERSPGLVREGGRLVSVSEEPPAAAGIDAVYFVVEPNRDQLIEIARLVDEGSLRPAIDSVYGLADAKAAFERNEARGKRGKVVILVSEG
jgi:NADPH:quinone reductase-like Zn-dependent oxidoreductase